MLNAYVMLLNVIYSIIYSGLYLGIADTVYIVYWGIAIEQLGLT